MTGLLHGYTFAATNNLSKMKVFSNVFFVFVMALTGVNAYSQQGSGFAIPSGTSIQKGILTQSVSQRTRFNVNQTPAGAFSGQLSTKARQEPLSQCDNMFKQQYGLKQHIHLQKRVDVNMRKLQDCKFQFGLQAADDTPFFKNRRNLYSSLWAFASLNYLYADLVAFMDMKKHNEYHTGSVNGVQITPGFITAAAIMMQIPISNVFLPHLIKNENTLCWVQIASGLAMTVIQSATLFIGKPAPYYVAFSTFEIAATTYITIDAIRWKPGLKK
jgi:hypothetical protein